MMARKLKTFPVTHIITTDDGRVIISGPKGSIDVVRVDIRHSSANVFLMSYHDGVTEDCVSSGAVHIAKIEDLPSYGNHSF